MLDGELDIKDELEIAALDDASELLTLDELAIDDEPGTEELIADELETEIELLDVNEDDELDSADELTSDELAELACFEELDVDELEIKELAIDELAIEEIATGAELAIADELAMDDELMELAAALLSVLLAALLIKDDDKLLAASALLATEVLGALLVAEEFGVLLLAATDDGVGEGAFVGSPPPPPQLERKPTTDKLNIAVLTRITNPMFKFFLAQKICVFLNESSLQTRAQCAFTVPAQLHPFYINNPRYPRI